MHYLHALSCCHGASYHLILMVLLYGHVWACLSHAPCDVAVYVFRPELLQFDLSILFLARVYMAIQTHCLSGLYSWSGVMAEEHVKAFIHFGGVGTKV